MSKTLKYLEKQLESEYKQDAEDCLKIYNCLKETTGNVWQSEWNVLIQTIFKEFPSDGRRFKPTLIGKTFLNGIK